MECDGASEGPAFELCVCEESQFFLEGLFFKNRLSLNITAAICCGP
jgi:hypothetical protein